LADSMKLVQVIRMQADSKLHQECLNRMTEWAEVRGMSFNIEICKVMHVGSRNPGPHEYSVGGIILRTTKEERYIGLTVSSSLKPGAQCKKAARTVSAVLGASVV
jgi:hypothetical protein